MASNELADAIGKADVAIVFDYAFGLGLGDPAARPRVRLLPAGVRDSTARMRRLGLSVDFVPGDSAPNLEGYGLVTIPGLFTWTPALIEAVRALSRTCADRSAKSGSKTADFAIPEALPPALPDDILSVRVSRIETLRADTPVPVKGVGTFKFWREYLEVGAGTGTVLSAEDGVPALVAKGNHYYLGGWPDEDLLLSILRGLSEQTGLAMRELPDGVRLRRHGQHVFALNYGAEPFDLADIGWSRGLLLGEAVLAPSGVAVARLTDAGY
jgi:beta-galactosidase